MSEKRFKFRADEIRPLVPGRGGCYASDHITVDGRLVGYLDREPPDGDWDSGWRFFSGSESDEFISDAANLGIYDVNTIADYDPEMITLLDAPFGSAFTRDKLSGGFTDEVFLTMES